MRGELDENIRRTWFLTKGVSEGRKREIAKDGFQLIHRQRWKDREWRNSMLVQIEAKVFKLKEFMDPNDNALQVTEPRCHLPRTIILPQIALPWVQQTLDDASAV